MVICFAGCILYVFTYTKSYTLNLYTTQRKLTEATKKKLWFSTRCSYIQHTLCLFVRVLIIKINKIEEPGERVIDEDTPNVLYT